MSVTRAASTPEIGPLAGDPDYHFVQVPLVVRATTAAPKPSRDDRSEFQHPASNCLIGYVAPALGEEILAVSDCEGLAGCGRLGIHDQRRCPAIGFGLGPHALQREELPVEIEVLVRRSGELDDMEPFLPKLERARVRRAIRGDSSQVADGQTAGLLNCALANATALGLDDTQVAALARMHWGEAPPGGIVAAMVAVMSENQFRETVSRFTEALQQQAPYDAEAIESAVAAAMRKKIKDRTFVETELATAAAEKLLGWAKLFATFVAVPIGLVAADFVYFWDLEI